MNPQQQEFTRQLQKVNEKYLDELEHILLILYHKHINDILTVDDIVEIGERFNLDIPQSYFNIIKELDNEEGDD